MSIKTTNLKIEGMHCEGCIEDVSRELRKISGITGVSIDNWENGNTKLTAEDRVSLADIEKAVEKAGYRVSGRISESDKESDFADQFDLIIIGGGSAAFSAAIKASELGKKILMINDGLPIGGTCVNVGCVPSKTLIRTAEVFYHSNHPNFFGIKHGKNRIDFKEVIDQKRELVNDLRQKKYVNVISDDPNITVLRGHAKLTGKNTIEVNGETKAADTILIATGSSTFIPDIHGLKDSGYYINDTLYELEELPEHLIIIGGRYIALENAQLFARLGSKVTVLQRSVRILPTEMPDISENLSGYLNDEEVDIKTGVKIHSVVKQNGKIVLKISMRDNDEIIEGTHLFVATGREGNTKNLGLEELGIKTHGSGFIETDEYQRTAVSNIYAAGDVTGEHLFVYTAAYAGALAVENAFTENKSEKDYSVLPWVIFTDPQVAGVGMDENQADAAGIGYDVSILPIENIPRALAARNTKGFIKLIRDRKTDKLVGARILASEGSELLMEISFAIKYGITTEEIKKMFHPYLTLSEGIKLAAIGFSKDVNKLSCCAV